MSLEQPKIEYSGKEPLQLQYEHSYTYSDPSLPGMKHHVKVSVQSFGDGHINEKGDMAVGYYYTAKRIPESALIAFVTFKKLVNNCVNYGEEINNLFLSLAKRSHAPDSPEAKHANSLDFLKLKDLLINKIKSNPKFKDLTNKEFRRSLPAFIQYRNIFTHGNLCLLCSVDGVISEDKFSIRFIDKPTQQEATVYVDRQLIKNYIETYQEILAFANRYIEANV